LPLLYEEINLKINIVFASRDISRASLFLETLGRNGYSVITAQKAKEVMSLLTHRACDMLLLGQNLLDEDGLSFLKGLRARNKILPVAVLLESPDTILEHVPAGFFQQSEGSGIHSSRPGASPKITFKLAFFQLGADECLGYNQDIHESMARIRAVLRRTSTQQPDALVKMGEIELNLSSYTLRISGKNVLIKKPCFNSFR